MKREPKRGIKLQLCRQLLRFYFRLVFVFVRFYLLDFLLLYFGVLFLVAYGVDSSGIEWNGGYVIVLV